MGFFTKIFSKIKKNKNKSIPNTVKKNDISHSNFDGYSNIKKTQSENYINAEKFITSLNNLCDSKKYLARSDVEDFVLQYKNTFAFFESLKKGEILSEYCQKNLLNEDLIELFLEKYGNVYQVIEKNNDKYIDNKLIEEKEYFDNILKKIDPNILLDEDQRKVILCDEDYLLVIAGAGAGKTTTVAAKVKYLVEKKNIDPKQILIISFTNKAVTELQERINQALGLPCPITTFHSAGNAILRKNSDEKKQIVSDGFLYDKVNEYLKSKVLTNPETVDNLIRFFGSYFTAPYEGNDINAFFNYISQTDFSTLKGNANEYCEKIIDRRTNKTITISDEILNSREEVQIANFLYINQIDYVYEKVYPFHILKSKKPYTPDFYISQGENIAYIEHFGITESGNHSFYSKEELERYKKEIKDKIMLHRQHNTKLIYTFSKYNDGRDLISHLKEQLEAENFVLKRRSSRDVFVKLVNSEKNKYIARLVKLICVFINNFKVNGYEADYFYKLSKNANVRTKLFLDICKECYFEYTKQLMACNSVDFQDLINDSARILREKQIAKEKLDFKYIIVDEYQDISRQRFDLTKELSSLCDAKVMAVGDDWQSIYAFSGSDVTLFTHFCDIMGYGKQLKITRTYRNAQEVIDIAGNFVQKNESQIKKTLLSPKHISYPVIINTYTENSNKKENAGKGGSNYNLGKEVEKVIGNIIERNKAEGLKDSSTILLIGRFNFDARNLCYSNDFLYDEFNNKIISKKYPRVKLEYLTAHSSKGLGFDNVVIVNARNGTYGFPSKIEDDPVMKYVIKDDISIEYAEERRLFYVAMTRTKNRVYIIVPSEHPSEFILELIKDYPNVTLNGSLSKMPVNDTSNLKKCPICGYPLKLRMNKNYGLPLWMCTNEPEICTFITNNLNGGKMSIEKCDYCKDGYLIVKNTKNGGAILGCTNYKENGKGCNRMMTEEYYNVWKNNDFEEFIEIDKPSYYTRKTDDIPEVIPVKKSDKKYKEVNKITYLTKNFEKDGFELVADNSGNIITDVELLSILRQQRTILSKRLNIAAYKIFTNKQLVTLATYSPTTKNDFIRLYGLSENKYNEFGLIFTRAIKERKIQ